MTTRQWYYAIDGSQQGPLSEQEIVQMFAAGRLRPETLVWTQGMETWAVASSIEALVPRDYTGFVASPVSRYPQYAGFWKRVVAVIIDGIVLQVSGYVAGALVGAIAGFMMGMAGVETEIIPVLCFVFSFISNFVLNWLYFTLMESSSKQATLGKMALGIVVTDMDGQRISLARANGRYWAKILSTLIFCIGYLMVAFTEKKQGLHDIMAGTLVVNK